MLEKLKTTKSFDSEDPAMEQNWSIALIPRTLGKPRHILSFGLCIWLSLAQFVRFSKYRNLAEGISEHVINFKIITNQSLKSLRN